MKFLIFFMVCIMPSKVAICQNWKNETSFQINYIHHWQIGEGSDRNLFTTNVGVQYTPKKVSIINLANNKVELVEIVEKYEDKMFKGKLYRIYHITNSKEKEIVLLGDGVVVFYRGGKGKGLVFANMEPKFIESLPLVY